MKRRFFLFLLILCLLPCLVGAEEDNALYPIRKNGLWGYMNRQGETVIVPQWKTAREFSGNTAIVSLNELPMNGSWDRAGHCDGLIDREGNYLIEPMPNQDIEEYQHEYRVRVYDDAYDDIEGFYDKASGFYQPPVPDYQFIMLWGEDGSGPVAVENSDGLVGYVDRTTGETVIPFRYTGDSDEVCFWGGYARPADEIIVEDSGSGFTKEALLHGTEQFFMDDTSRNGEAHYGMGLFFAKTVTEKYGGGIKLSNSENTGGARVEIFFLSSQETR